MKKWKTESSEKAGDYLIFSIHKRRNRSPASGKEGEFFVIEAPNWVNVIALTPEESVVLIDQFRHGSEQVELEIPGGCIDSGESPLAAARRELEEETGYTSSEWVELGWNSPNPAILSNRCYTFLARNVRLSSPQALDGLEEIEVRTVPLANVPKLIASHEIRHSLVITAFYFLDLWKSGKGGRT